MAKVNTTFYGWSWGELEFDWTTVGPFKVRIITLTITLITLTLTLYNTNPNANPNLPTSRWKPSTRRPKRVHSGCRCTRLTTQAAGECPACTALSAQPAQVRARAAPECRLSAQPALP